MIMNEETETPKDNKEDNITVNISDKTMNYTSPLMLLMTFIMAIGNFAKWWVIPWVWVFCPLWWPFALLGSFFVLIFGLVAIACLFGGAAFLYGWFEEKFKNEG
jgi:hypothetical protein